MDNIQIKILIASVLFFLSIEFVNGQCISTFPYNQSFNSSNASWNIDGISGTPASYYDLFEYGHIADAWYPYYKSDQSDNYFKTDFGGSYAQETDTWVTSPCFDLSSLITPEISLDIYADALAGIHGAWIEYSVNNGLNWTILGSGGEGQNWYDNVLITGEDCWANTSGAWITATHSLSNLTGMTNVIFRLHFKAGYIPTTLNGFAFDNISIYETATVNSPQVSNWIHPSNTLCALSSAETPIVEVENLGLNTISNFYIRYLVNGSASTWDYVSNSLSPGDSYIHTFSSAFDFSVPGNYLCQAQFSLDGVNVLNTLDYTLSIEGLPVISSFPFTEDFSATTPEFGYNNGLYSQSSVTSNELLISGTGNGNLWTGGSYTTTSSMAWNDNAEYKTTVYTCSVDASSLSTLELVLDLYQEFSYGPKYSWFRVLVNDVPVADKDGVIDHNPDIYATPEYKHQTYDLNVYAGSSCQIKFEAVTKLSDDIVKLDNIIIRQKLDYDLVLSNIVSPSSGCSLATVNVIVNIENIGLQAAGGFDVWYSIDGGATTIIETFSSTILPDQSTNFVFATSSDFSNGANLEAGIIWTQDQDTINNTSAKVISDISTDLSSPYIQDFNGASNVILSDNWMVVDGNNDGENWEWYSDTTGEPVYGFDYESAVGDDYLFTKCFNFDNQEQYIVSFDYASFLSSSIKNLQLYLATSQDISGLISPAMIELSNINTNASYINESYIFNVPVSGEYFLAFKASGAATIEAEYVFIDNVILSTYVGPDLKIVSVDAGTSSCTLSNSTVNISITNLSGSMISSGDSLQLSYMVNSVSYIDNLLLSSDFAVGDTINYTFSQDIDMANEGVYIVACDVNYQWESNPLNDELSDTIIHYGYAENLEINNIEGGYCLNSDPQNISGSFISQIWAEPYTQMFISSMGIVNDNGDGTAVLNPNILGVDTISYLVTNAGGCQSIVSAAVSITNPSVDLGQDIYVYDYSTVVLDAGAGNYDYNWSSGETSQTIAPPYYGEYSVTVTEDYCSASDSIWIFINHDINFRSGWGMWSTFIDVNTLPSKSADDILAPLTELIISKDNNGLVWWPYFGVNTIGDINNGEGYQYKMQTEQQLVLGGMPLVPELTTYHLLNGYSLMGYTKQLPSPAAYEITQSGILPHLIIFKDEDGFVFWPEFNIDLIGDLLPGKAYKLSVDFPMDFSYSANSINNIEKHVVNIEPKHFDKAKVTNSNMTLGIPLSAWDTKPDINDEIAISDEHGNLVGSSVFTGGNMSIAIFGDDGLSESKDGLITGENFSLSVWKQIEDIEKDCLITEMRQGSNSYTDDGISIVKSIITDVNNSSKIIIKQNSPNPFNENSFVEFYLPESSFVNVFIYNSLGEKIKTLKSMEYSMGWHKLRINSKDISAGMYYYKFICGSYSKTMSFIISRN